MKENNYITILGWMTNLGLNPNELLVFALIYGFCQDGQSKYTGSTTYIVNLLNISKNTAKSILNKLSEKKLIVLHKETKNNVTFNTYSISGTVYQNLAGGRSNFGMVGGSKIGSNISSIEITNNINSYTNFKKFTLEDFRNEISKHKTSVNLNQEDLKSFYDYWRELTPSGKMKFQIEKSWQTDLRLKNWERNKSKFGNKQIDNPQPEKFKSPNRAL